MPRKRRHWVPGIGAHTISRFVDRRFVLESDSDRRMLLDCIDKAHHRWDWKWLSYGLMSSHLHYGHVAGERNPDRFYASAHTRFAQRFHRGTEGATLGHVFAERPTIHPVRTQALLQRMVAYHHRNPPEAGVVTRPRDSRWTSHRAYLRLEPEPAWLDVEWGLSMLGFEDTVAGRRRFDVFVTEVPLDPEGWMGPPSNAEVVIREQVAEVDWALLERLARGVTGLDHATPISSRGRLAVMTRWLIGRIATRDLGQTYAAVAKATGMSTGGLFNLLSRKRVTKTLEEYEARVREALLLSA